MALSKSKKNERVKQLASELEHSTSAIIGTFKGLNAAKDFDLRKTIRAAGGRYHVVKNKLAQRSAEGTKVEAALKGLKGVSSVAYTSGDPVALAKALSNWVKDNAEFTFKLGIVDGKVINVTEIESLAKLPGKEELFSKLLFLINAPATRLATVINATGRNLAVVVNQAVEQNKFAAPAKAEEPAKTEAAARASEAPAAQAAEAPAATEAKAEATEAAAHVEESAAGEQPSGAAEPENSTASQGGEAASTDPVEG